MKKILGVIVLGLLLSGCYATTSGTSAWSHFNQCSLTTSNFIEMVECGEQNRNNYLKMNPSMVRSDAGNLYINYAKVLAAGVKNKEISETNAKLKLLEIEQKLVAKVDANNLEIQRQQNQALTDFSNSMKTTTTTCTTLGTQVSCTSF
jgi:hypothetical protein